MSWVLRAGMILGLPLLSVVAAAQEARLDKTSDYDMAAQPLRAALQQFSAVSRFDILYKDTVIEGRRASAVRGHYTPQAAMRVLLDGTGLEARFTGERSVLIVLPEALPRETEAPTSEPLPDEAPHLMLDMLEVRASPILAGEDRLFHTYGRYLAAKVDAALRPEFGRKTGRFVLMLHLWVTPSGDVKTAELVSGSDDAVRDRAIIARAEALRFDAPPAGLPQPVRLKLELRP